MVKNFSNDISALMNPFVLIILCLYFGRIMYTDWKYRKIENKANLALVALRIPLILLGFEWKWSYLGAGIGFFAVFLIAAMLMYVNMDGDIKAVGALGLYLNIVGGVYVILGAVLVTLLAVLIFKKTFSNRRFPYGVALGVSFLSALILNAFL